MISSRDFIGRFETISADFSDLRLRLGIGGELPHLNKSKRDKDYRTYYSEKNRGLIGKAHQKDIETFGYEF